MSCNLKKIKTDFFVKSNEEPSEFQPDPLIVIKEDYLKATKNVQFEKPKTQQPDQSEWYPNVNSYYSFAENVDPLERAGHLLSPKPSFVRTPNNQTHNEVRGLQYTEKEAQQFYLQSNPLSFIILGKSGSNEEQLGKELAEYWKCVYIEPQFLIEQEIQSESRTGQCMEYNLRCGKAIGIDCILRLVEKKIKSQTAQHRGFLICGLPLVPNKLYTEDSLHTESAVVAGKEIVGEILNYMNVKYESESQIDIKAEPHIDIKAKRHVDIKAFDGEEDGEEVEIASIFPEQSQTKRDVGTVTSKEPQRHIYPLDLGDDQDVCYPPDIGTNYEKQLELLFDLLKVPFFIIYIMCTPKDIMTRRKNMMYDIDSKSNIDLLQAKTNSLLNKYFASDGFIFHQLPDDNFDTYTYPVKSGNEFRHLLTLPKNFEINIEAELDHFYYTAVNFIETRILAHDPQYFIKVDGRTSVRRMLHIIKSKMNCLPLQKVIIPERVILKELLFQRQNDQTDRDDNEAYQLSFDQHFQIYRKIKIVGEKFKWNWSDWGAKCPVCAKNGIFKNGNPNFAVHFMNKLFFLADQEAYIKFCRNPRPYLLGINPVCKFWIFGPKCSGKSAVAKSLSLLFNATIITTGVLDTDFLINEERKFYDNIRQKALEEGLFLLNKKRKAQVEKLEARRLKEIKKWLEEVTDLIKQLIHLIDEHEKELEDKTEYELSSFPLAMKTKKMGEWDTKVVLAMVDIRNDLEELNIPSMGVYEYPLMLKDKQVLFSYLPENLRKKNIAEPASIKDEFVINYINKAINSNVFEGVAVMRQKLINILLEDLENAENTGESAWIIDGMHCDLHIIEAISSVYMPDEIIILKDTDDFKFLRERYKTKGANQFYDFKELFTALGKAEAVSSFHSIDEKTQLTSTILSELFDNIEFEKTDEYAADLIRNENYYTDLLKFKMSWSEVEDYLKELKVTILEVQVTNKSIEELIREIIVILEDRYRVLASPFTEQDRAEEVQTVIADCTPEKLLEDGAVQPAFTPDAETLEKHRLYGDTYHYCPVTFHEYWVLWKGKEQFAVKFEDRIYLLCNEREYKRFLFSPREYLTGSPCQMPPPRICIIGPPGSGKTNLARSLSENYGIRYIDYEWCLKTEFGIENDKVLEDLKKTANFNETLLRYLDEDTPLPESVYTNEMSNYWFRQPTKQLGFVLDNFPRRPSDIDMMLKLKLIPDIIIELTVDEELLKERLTLNRFQDWLVNINDYYLEKENEFQETLENWIENRKKKFSEMLEQKREERYEEKRKNRHNNVQEMKNKQTDENQKREKENKRDAKNNEDNLSQVSFDSITDQQDVDEINRILDEIMPMVTPAPIETPDEMKRKIFTNITNYINTESIFLDQIRTVLQAESLPHSLMAVDIENYEKNTRNIYYLTEKFKYRNISHFERCRIISMDLANNLLSCGYFFLSQFGKICPVQYRENNNPFFTFCPAARDVLPVIHRSFIYFINGIESFEKFEKNPLLYIDVDKVEFPLIPIQLAVTGPPKCGKTTLANRIAREYGMKVISRGKAIRFVLSVLPFSSLAKSMEIVLRNGWEVTDEMVAKSIHAASIDPRGITQGIVFDGFPNTIPEVKQLSYVGLVPQLVFDLQATRSQMFECYDTMPKFFMRFSNEFVNHLRDEWEDYMVSFQPWFDEEYQVTYKIPIEPSIWSTWARAREVIIAALFEIKHYFIKCDQNWPLRLAYMQVTPLEFLQRKSTFEAFCPCCIHFGDGLVSGGLPPDRAGLVQWRKHIYWICNKHIELFLKSPDDFLLPYVHIAQELPVIIKLKSYPCNVIGNGYCASCYRNRGRLKKGFLNLAVEYREKVYLFDDKSCLQIFLKNPNLYGMSIHFKKPKYPSLDFKELPLLGMLEQYVAKDVIQAVKFVSRRRPVIAGLSVSTSAAIAMALYMKISRETLPEEIQTLYKEASDQFYIKANDLLDYLNVMKNIINPYLYYEEPLPKYRYWESNIASNSSSSTRSHFTQAFSDMVVNTFPSTISLTPLY